MTDIYLIAHDIRSTHNVGSLIRTAEGLGVKKLYLTGYTPYPIKDQDRRLPHESAKIDKQIQKTALGSQNTLDWEQKDDVNEVINYLREQSIPIAGLEQTDNAIRIDEFKPPKKIALILGSEVDGMSPELISSSEYTLFIPMFGQKESFNVVQAAAMALYHLTFY